MLASYAVILRRSALVTAPVAVAMIVLSGIVGGSKGLVGALLGVGLVIVFFGISAFAMARAARHSPQVMMVTAITTYLVKILVLLFFVAKYSGTTAFNGKLFGFTVIACIIVWTTSQAVISAKLKVPYVEPYQSKPRVPSPKPDQSKPKVPSAEPDGSKLKVPSPKPDQSKPEVPSAEPDGSKLKVPYAEPDGKR